MARNRSSANNGENPHPYIAPLIASLTLVPPAALAVLFQDVILFASLGPTAVMQAQAPERRSSSLYSVVVSHLGGFGVASVTVALLGIAHAPSVFVAHTVSIRRAIAAIVALGAATALEILLRAPHPPAGSTTLLVALGSMKPDLHTFALFATGVLAVGLTGEATRYFRGHGAAAGGTAEASRQGTPLPGRSNTTGG